jgi:serine/threonine protein kinase
MSATFLMEFDNEVESCSWNCLGDEVRSRPRCGPSRLETDERSSDSEHEVRIGDFGSSKFEAVGLIQTIAPETLLYMAPELYETDYDNKVDVYSFA